MKKLHLMCLLIFIAFHLQGQGVSFQTIKEGKDMISFYATNTNFCPYQGTIRLKDSVEVLLSNLSKQNYFSIAAQTSKQLLFKVKLNDTLQTTLNYDYSLLLGDTTSSKPDTNFVYFLPYAHQTKQKMMQGYNGRFSHRGQFALDFRMKKATPICAARSGVVVKVKQDSNKGGAKSKYSADANLIVIYHPEDGTFAYYLHLLLNGSKVKVGEQVKAGQNIALSGNTGWSTIPHLHFVAKKSIFMDYETIPTKFQLSENSVGFIKKKGKYFAFHY